jgi:FixJ family two-component response regulator
MMRRFDTVRPQVPVQYRRLAIATVSRGNPHVPTGSANIVAIVDDDGDVREVLDALLESVGHTVKTYRKGQQLLDDPDLSDVACLIVDQKMPEMTGLALLRELNISGRAIPSVLITGLPDARIAAEARELGALDVFVKPIDWEKLLKLVAYTVQ